MGERAVRVAWFRFRATFHRRWGGYLSIVLLVGLLGGVALASIAGARRTESSFSQFIASTDPSDLIVLTGLYQPAPTGYDPGLIRKIAHLPFVTRVESEAGYEAVKVDAQGYVVRSAVALGNPRWGLYSSIDGVNITMDRLVLVSGHLPNPASRLEVAVTPDAARLLGLHVGSSFPLGVVGDVQSTTNCQRCRPIFHAQVRVVGIVTTSASLIIDDTDRSPTIFATPAFTRPLLQCCVDPTLTHVQISGGVRHLRAVESEIARILPPRFPRLFAASSSAAAAVAQRVIQPDAIALGVFGLIVALVTLVIAVQLIGRQLRLEADELSVVRALGAGPSTTSVIEMIGVVGAAAAGSILAGVIALTLSPLAPIGPVRPVYPTPGVSLDPLVIGLGVAVLVVVLTVIASVIGFVQAPHRAQRRRARASGPTSLAVRAAMVLGLGAPAVCGIRFALVPGSGRRASPVRSAVVGSTLALTVVLATLTMGSSLNTLVSHPRLYGWNWTVAMDAAGGVGVLPQAPLAQQLNGDHDVTAWSGMYFSQLQIDGREVPVLGASPGAAVSPPVLSGHGVSEPGQIVLGSATLAELHKRVGETVRVSNGTASSTTLRIVGTVTLPAIGGSLHTELGTGAILDYHLIPASARNLFNLPGGGPNIVLIRLRSPTTAAALARLGAVATVLEKAAQDSVNVVPVQRPAEIANAGTLRATPAYLALALAGGAVVALGLILLASVRRRRRELALLKTLGFTQRQLAAVLAWQATVAAVIGAVVGIPLGVLVGRELWIQFAHSIHVVPSPVVPVWLALLVGFGALGFANLVAILPGRSAARTPAGLVLRAE
ncbi:MAG: ABC transporter permease [Acidimicrobiales bacterium]